MLVARSTSFALAFSLLATSSLAQNVECVVTRKIDVFDGKEYTVEQLAYHKFSVILLPQANTIGRCSFQANAGQVTCDTYSIDRADVAAGFVDIKKFYYFAGQFDLQIFNATSFIENNGRGSIATGFCTPF